MLLLIFLSACSVDYDLLVTNDKQFIEKITLTVSRDLFPTDNETAHRYINRQINDFRASEAGTRLYSHSFRMTRDWVYITFEGRHRNYEIFENTVFYPTVFDTLRVKEDNTYRLVFSDFVSLDDEVGLIPPPWRDDLKITMKFHNQVLQTNADEENYGSNVFVWRFDGEDSERTIEVELDYSSRYDIIIRDALINNFISIIIVGALLVSIVFGYFYYIARNRFRNQF